MTKEWFLLLVLIWGCCMRDGIGQELSDGCGTSKMCYRDPSSCTDGTDCEFFVSWTFDGNAHTFTMTGSNAAKYIALGFSKSGLMRDSDVYACTSNLEVVRSRNTFGNSNDPTIQQGVSDITVTVKDGRILCSFTRAAALNGGDDNYYDLSEGNSYTIIMAKSSQSFGLQSDGSIGFHESRVYDNKKTSFDELISDSNTGLQIPMTTVPDQLPMTPEQVLDSQILTTGCGNTKGCFRHPPDCSRGNDCEFFVSWTSEDDNNNVFTMTASNAATYVAFGFSKSGRMENSDVYACTSNGEVVRSRNTDGNANDPNIPLKGISNQMVSLINGRIECEFTRKTFLTGNDETYYDLSGNNSYNIIMAKSNGRLRPDGNINIHSPSERVQGTQAVSFHEFNVISGEDGDLTLILQKVHGSIMTIAWILFASVGITIARFYKTMWPNRRLCGKHQWFVLHRTLMVLTALSTVAGFIIIFVQKKEFVKYSEEKSGFFRFLHGVLGTIVTGLVIVNPIMAIFRPDPGEQRRPIFNFMHWAVGIIAYTTSMVTICLGLGYQSAQPLITNLPSYLFWIIIVFMAFHVVIWILMQLTLYIGKQDNKDNIEGVRTDNQGQSTLSQAPVGSSTMSAFLALYCLASILTVGFLVFGISTVGLTITNV